MSSDERNPKAAPGGAAAVAAGCTCAIIDNSHGKGINGDGAKYGWWISADCPLHGRAAQPAGGPADAE